ncbi:hypothetical protein [Rhodococcus gannanensis]|uniref:Uncharacterized protein n=1 Tax=Rhodococcus gannanensis TaxID=1960308 RepID=A0ABW4NYT7_9NOCA
MGEILDAGQPGSLSQAVTDGALRLDEGVAERCIGACDALLAELDALGAEFNSGQWRPRFGAFSVGEELAVKFEKLANGPEGSLRVALLSHIEVVKQMRDLFEAAGRAYREAEEANAARLAAVGDSL